MLALIGGTGLNTLEGIEGFQLSRKEGVATRYSETAVEVCVFSYSGVELLFIPRHGDGHVVAPHRIN